MPARSDSSSAVVIPIFFTFDEHYVLPASVTFHSLLAHANPLYRYALHVLHMGLSERSQRLLQRTVARFNQATLYFHDLSHQDVELAGCEGKSHFSREIYFKLCAADLFPHYDRILCSDVDVVFLGDISPAFFAFEGEDFYYAGVDTVLPTQRMKGYQGFNDEELHWLAREICACFLLFDLHNIRRDKMQAVMTAYYQQHYDRLPFPEQDCMALTCRGRTKILPLATVVQNNYYTVDVATMNFYQHSRVCPNTNTITDNKRSFCQALQQPIQLHYIGPNKPWNALCVPRQIEWWKVLLASRNLGNYLRTFPTIVGQRLRRYNLRRLVRKLQTRFFV